VLIVVEAERVAEPIVVTDGFGHGEERDADAVTEHVLALAQKAGADAASLVVVVHGEVAAKATQAKSVRQRASPTQRPSSLAVTTRSAAAIIFATRSRSASGRVAPSPEWPTTSMYSSTVRADSRA
jgi:hypothetical protein